MNKEEIEKALRIGDDRKVEEYIKELEQKESMLDKITDKLKEIRRELDDDGFTYYAQEITKILNIIEGEKK